MRLTAKVTRADLLTVTEFIEAGKLTPVVDTTYPLSEVPKAIRRWEDNRAQGKVAITIVA